MTDEIRKKISKSNLGKRKSSNARENMRKSAINRKASDLTKIKMSIFHKERLKDPETRLKLSESRKGKNNGMYGKRGKDNPNFGRTLNESEKLKYRGNNNGMYGKKHTEEALKKMRKIVYQFNEDNTLLKSGNLQDVHQIL
jgi:hypothetical protein